MTNSSTPMDSTVTDAVETAIKAALDEQGGGTCISATLSTGCVWYGGLLLDVKMLAHAAILAMRSASPTTAEVAAMMAEADRLAKSGALDWDAFCVALNEARYMDALAAMRSASLPSGEVKSAREALSRYGRHETVCGLYVAMGRPCVCGWHEIRQALTLNHQPQEQKEQA